MLEALHPYWTWWRDQLLDLVPGQAERRLIRADDAMLLDLPDGNGVTVVERQGGVEQPLAFVPLDGADAAEQIRQTAARRRWKLVLRLPATMLLERDVSLPLAAEREIGRVVFHEMDRFTPFAANEVFWSWLPRARDRAHGRLHLRLSLVPRAPLDPLIARLAQAGLPPDEIELPGPDGLPRRIALDRVADDVTPRRFGPVALALAGCAALALLAITLPFLLQTGAASAVEARIAAEAPAVARVQQLRKQMAAGNTGADVVAVERRRAGDALEAIALLTDALPDNTYLTALTFDAGKLTMDGQSKAAAALIAPLTANRRFQDASFTAPVVRNTLGNDTFSLRLTVLP